MKVSDPGLFALRNAARAAIVMPAAFAVALTLAGAPMALFAGFGSMALLVFVDFGGPRRTRLVAYLLLAAGGAALVALGTLCSRTTWLAAVTMLVVGFAILFAGVLSGYLAAGQPAATLAFVLSVMVPAGPGAIPLRLAGWGLAAAASIAAAMLLWPARPRDRLRTDAAEACRAVADVVAARADGDGARVAACAEAADRAVAAVHRRFVAMPYRPSGTGGRTGALAHLVDDLGWLNPFAQMPQQRPPAPLAFPVAGAAVDAAVVQALRASAAQLDGRDGARPDLARLERARAALGAAFLGTAADTGDGRGLSVALAEAFRLRATSYAAWQTGRHALLACGLPAPEEEADDRPASSRLAAARRLAGAHASMRSVWLHNSVRGACGLALAVLVGQLVAVQHAFWVVLGTTSVLRSQALTTGSTVLQALAGTVVGIVLGGAVVIAFGAHHAVGWALLPPAVLLAAYAPRAISFAAGQVGFTVLVLILFNLLQPAGWKAGLVRIEDVAIGCAISLAVGALFWPRGASAAMRVSVAEAYGRAADYLGATVGALLEGDGSDVDAGAVRAESDDAGPSGATGAAGPRSRPAADASASLARAERDAIAAGQRLDDTVREYLAERSSARAGLADLTALVAGVTRVRRTAHMLDAGGALVRLGPIAQAPPGVARAAAQFEAETDALCAWFSSLGDALAAAAPPPAPQPATATPEVGPAAPGLAIAWAHRHLEVLRRLEVGLAQAAARVGRAAG